MDNHWTNPPEFRSLPWGPRIWLWWCRRGPKRIGGGTVGGNRLFSICRWMLGRWPAGIDNLYPVHSRQRGMTIFIDLLDFEAYQHTVRLFSGGGTESVLQSMFLKDGATFIDIGANHGAYSLFGAKQVGSSGRVFSIEPQPRLAAALRQSVLVNGLTNIEVEECAISNRLGEETFYLSSSSSGTASLFQSDMIDESRTLNVRVETLDAFASRHEIKELQLLKVDAEGSEANVFRGAANVLTNLRPYVWFEFNPAALIEAGERVSVLAEVLSQYGYTRLYNLTSVVRGEPQEVKPSSNFLNIFAVHENREKEFAETLLHRRRVEGPRP